jgi:TatD DNase family protein
MLIDTHCHLDFPDFDPDRAAVLRRARLVGVEQIVVPSITVDNFERVLELCATDSRLYPALGLHPCFSHDPVSDLERLDKALSQTKGQVVAIGEIGLDFRPEYASPEQLRVQEQLFKTQLQLAKVHELPVLIHAVKAHDQVLKWLRQYQLPRAGIIHAFSGSEQQAREYAKLGFKLGFGGAVTYERAHKLRRLAAELPLEWLVLETDAPDMPLQQYLGQPNEPARVAEVAALIAELRNESVEHIAAVTTATAEQLLGLSA